MKTHNTSSRIIDYCKVIVQKKIRIYQIGFYLLLLVCFIDHTEVKAQYSFSEDLEPGLFTYDEIPVLVLIDGYNSFYVNAIYANNEKIYVNIEELFNTLKIPCIKEQNGESITGFIKDESQKYSVNFKTGQIIVGTKTIDAKDGILNVAGSFFLEASFFSEGFGIKLTFNFRALTLFLISDFELPVIKQQRLENMRDNISKLRGVQIADTTVERNYHLFKFGAVDWSVASYQKWNGSIDNRFGLGIGTELLYGELNMAVNYYDQYKFNNRQLNYLWRWVDNEKKLIKQAQVGKISTQTIAFINSPIIGATIRNSPTTVRKAKGYHTINEYTEPNWDVELYINNVMVDFTKADASGLYVFKVPIVYGYTTLKMVFYGPLGEERTQERIINLPYSIMPANEFEYGISAGMLQDSTISRFGRADFNYGVNSYLTVGGGLEYLSSIPNGAFIPFVRATLQPYNKFTLNVEYAHGVKSRGVLNFYFLKDALMEFDYSKYVEGQLATRFNALEERKVKLSIPFRIKRFRVFSQADFAQFVYQSFNYNQASLMFSAYYKQYSANSVTQLNWVDSREPYATSIVSTSYRLKGYVIRPSAQYNITNNKLMLWKIALEKNIPRGFFSASYERNIMYSDNYIHIGFRYDLSFARTNVSASHNRGNISTVQSAQGSLAFGSGNKYVHTSNNSSVGRGGISLYPFLDINGNGIFDEGEPMVKLSTVRVMGSTVIYSETDSIVRITGLNPFVKHIITLSDNDLESIAWRFKHKTYEVLVDPNQFKRIDIPVEIVGEYTGMVYLNQNNSLKGTARISVKFYEKNSTKVYAETLSEFDGYIYYLGLEPGEYIASLDSVQLNNLDYTVEPKQIDFTINPSIDGDMVTGSDFILYDNRFVELPKIELAEQLSTKEEESIFEEDEKINVDLEIYAVEKPIDIQKDKYSTDFSDENAQFWGDICNEPGKFYVQCGAFRVKSNATNLALFISQKTDKTVGISFIDGYYKVQVGCVLTRKEADEIRILMEEIVINTDMFFKARRSKDVIHTPAP